MAGSRRTTQATSEVQDYSSRYPGGEKIEQPSGEWFEFKDKGDELVGEYLGKEPFRNGVKGSMQTKDGLVVFSVPTMLRQQLDKVKVGDKIAIVLAGFKESAEASPIKLFEVYRLNRAK